MGNKILGRRSRSFYKGFNERQVEYLKQKFEMVSIGGKLDSKKFMQAYKLSQFVSERFLNETDFDQSQSIDEYQFICMVHSICCQSVQELGGLFFKILLGKSKNSQGINQKSLQQFTKVCLQYNSYIQKTQLDQKQLPKINKNKFQKYDYDKNKYLDQSQFVKICLKDQDYKKWMYNMGFITKRQMDFQDSVYDLVDSDMGEQIDRHDRQNNQNISKIKQGIQHRIQDDQFHMEEVVGEQTVPEPKPWIKQVKQIKIQIQQNKQPPNPSLQIDYVFGYRSFDCRNNVKFDSKGRVIYHQAAIGIVLQPGLNKQQFLIQHHDDITCLDIVQDTVVSGQTGSNPNVIMWETVKKTDQLTKTLIVNQFLKDGISNVCLSPSKRRLAVMCNDKQHKLVIYDVQQLKKYQQNPSLADHGVIAYGPCTQNIPFDLKFDVTQRYVVVATLKEILFVTFQKGKLNGNRAVFGNFSVTAGLCLEAFKFKYKGQQKQVILSGMGNGSVYFWQNQSCYKAVTGHNGSVSSLCLRKDKKSFISGDKNGTIIIWGQAFQKQHTITIPKSNCISNMIVSLACNKDRQILIGTKASDIFILKIGDNINKAKKIMSGHNQGQLKALAVDTVQNFIYTGGEDRRLIKWQYAKNRKIQMQKKCQYSIASIDIFVDQHDKQNNFLVVGYKNGVVECLKADKLQPLQKRFTQIKNPDQQVLNLVKINKDGDMCVACYQYPKYKIALLNIITKQKIHLLSQIPTSSKIIAIDFDKKSKYIRFNTQKCQYIVYNISDFKKPVEVKSSEYKQLMFGDWATHTLPYTAETQAIYTDGVVQSDIVCCQRSRHVLVVGDQFSKIKLFNYPCKQNKIYNKYVGHSNKVTKLKFDYNKQDNQAYLISIGGQQKSIIVWRFNPEQLKNQWLIEQLGPEQVQQKLSVQAKTRQKMLNQYQAQNAQGEQAMSTKPFKGQIKPPSNFKQKYNSRRDNVLPKAQVSIKHVFGLRNKYINDQVRNHVRFAAGYKQVIFPTACLGVKMSIQTKKQEFYHAHKQDIISFAIDPTRKFMATGQMAEKNPSQPRKKIVCVYVWDLQTKQPLKMLDGFHTIAVVLLSFSPNSKLLFTCGNDDKNTFAIYNWSSSSILYSGPSSRAKLNGIAWKTNQQFLTCSTQNVKFWTGSKGCNGKIQGKTPGMYSCVSSKNIYITGCGEGSLYNWIGNIGKKVPAHKGKVNALMYYNEFVYSGAADGKILIWKTQGNGGIKDIHSSIDTRSAFQQMLKTIKKIPEQQFGVLSIDIGKNKQQLLIGTVGASIIHKNGQKFQIIHQGHYKGQLWALSTCLRNKQTVITGGDDNSVRLWDIQKNRQINRVYFKQRIRGLDWSSDGSKVIIADVRGRIFLYNSTLTDQIDVFQKGVCFQKNKQTKDPFIQEIKFSPNNQMVAYGSHGISRFMQILNVSDKKIQNRKVFQQGTSALLHVDWSRDSQYIAINSQAYQYLFFTNNGKMTSASSLCDEPWATYTRKIGWQVQGIFQDVDYTNVNTVCREPNSKFIAVGYDDQCIRLFKYPCYIPRQVHKVYYGHSSHVTRVKFTSNQMVSVGGLDRTLIVWDVQREDFQQKKHSQDSDDGLDDLEEDVDLPQKAVTRKVKPKKVQQFYQVEDEGDQFQAVKPWLGAIKQPTYQYPKNNGKKPNVQVKLQYVHGYRVKDCRQNLYYCDKQTIIYHAAAVLIYHNIEKNEQKLLNDHNDDILSIDYHRSTNQVITGELGPKPLVCLYKDAKLVHKFVAPVKKGVLTIAISPDGKKAACAGMEQDHYVAVLDLQSGKVLDCQKGTKKVITKIVWTGNNSFVTVGISHYRYWNFDTKLDKNRQSPKRYNFVSAVFDPQTKKVFTGASQGTIVSWIQKSQDKPEIVLTRQRESQYEEGKTQIQHIPAGVVDCLLIEKDYLLAGTKDGSVFFVNKKNKKVLKQVKMDSVFQEVSLNLGIRALNILNNKMLVGTLASQIYQLNIDNLDSQRPFTNSKNIVRCHYSPNNTWTNEVWGLHIHDNYVFTCSDDATIRIWSIPQRKLLSCTSTNYGLQKGQAVQLPKDVKTNDFADSAKCRAISVSPDGKWVVTGAKNGDVRLYSLSIEKDFSLILKNLIQDASQWISDIKFAYNTLIVGSHDNAIYVYNFQDGILKRKYAPLRKHSSYITHMDVSRDSCFLQSTCGAYELLFWDLNTGKQITSGATMLRDQRWATWTCNLGWPVQGIYPKVTDGTFINAVDRSKMSINGTQSKRDTKSPYLLAAGNDNGKVAVYNYPCVVKSSEFVEGKGHSSHVTTVRWSTDDRYIISVGGEDQCVMYWSVQKKK